MDYDWQGDSPSNHQLNESIIYEMNVGGFTKSPGSGVKNPGTYAGIIEKTLYLSALGITAVKLLSVFEFEDFEVRYFNGNKLPNYRGYSNIHFFARHLGYCVNPDEGNHLDQFRYLVKARHQADVSVILDVVFKHTDEGDHRGPIYSFKGFYNDCYYFLIDKYKNFYCNYSGCANIFKCNRSYR
jgi:isoamylase